ARMAKQSEFRQDLLYRLSEFTLRIPPLRERKEDIAPIALAMLNRDGHARSLSVDAIEYLQQLDWPGNIRELRNVMRRAAAPAGRTSRCRSPRRPTPSAAPTFASSSAASATTSTLRQRTPAYIRSPCRDSTACTASAER